MFNETSINKISKINGVIIKSVFFIVLPITIVASTSWSILYSVSLANFSLIIQLRNWYQDTFWNTEGLFLPKQRPFPPFDPIYTIQAQKSPISDSNFYVFWGKFSNFDSSNYLLSLKGYDGKIYTFLVTKFIVIANNDSLETNSINPKGGVNIVSVDDFFSSLNGGSILKILWDDKRSLSEILKEGFENGNSLNKNGSKYFIITKVE